MKPLKYRLLIISAFACMGGAESNAGLAYFRNSTDTISVSGGTTIANAITIEAVVIPIAPVNGMIFNEYTFGLEDKMLGYSQNEIGGYIFPLTYLAAPVTISLGVSHHLAYVYDGAQDRIYVDGILFASRLASIAAGNGSGAAFVGAINRTDGFQSGFHGYMDSLRVSNAALYSGPSFAAPTGDLTADGTTVLLYNFNESPGSTTVADLSGNGLTGTLGSGFAGATSPQLVSSVPEPASAGLLGLGAILIAIRRRRSTFLNGQRFGAHSLSNGQ
ncbi:MAG: LamG-like jellyroll fold domain-containing protein [Verrucomicrobiota bacterium]